MVYGRKTKKMKTLMRYNIFTSAVGRLLRCEVFRILKRIYLILLNASLLI